MSHKCLYCEKSFYSYQKRDEHMLIHLNVRIQCDECGKSYSNNANLNKHMLNKHPKPEKTITVKKDSSMNTIWSQGGNWYICGECKKFFDKGDYSNYLQHISEH